MPRSATGPTNSEEASVDSTGEGSRCFQSPVLVALGLHNQTPQKLPLLLGVPQAVSDWIYRKVTCLLLKIFTGKFSPRYPSKSHISLWSQLLEHPAVQSRSCFPHLPAFQLLVLITQVQLSKISFRSPEAQGRDLLTAERTLKELSC